MNKMITTVTLNAAIDKSYWISGFKAGTVNRTSRMVATAGGKGLNVARILQQLKQHVTATGFIGGFNGQYILHRLDQQGVKHDFVEVEGESRLCLNILDESSGTRVSTEILEQGPTITRQDIQRMEAVIERLASCSQVVTFSGSLPAGAPSDLYASLVQIAQQQGAEVFLDTSGEALQLGLTAKPSFIKPNEHEIGAIIGQAEPSESDLMNGIRFLLEQGIRTVVVSLGGKGSIAGHQGNLYRVFAPQVPIANTVGCGDAFVAAMAAAAQMEYAIDQSLVYATAVASASAMTDTTGSVRLEDIDSLLPQIRIEQI